MGPQKIIEGDLTKKLLSRCRQDYRKSRRNSAACLPPPQAKGHGKASRDFRFLRARRGKG